MNGGGMKGGGMKGGGMKGGGMRDERWRSGLGKTDKNDGRWCRREESKPVGAIQFLLSIPGSWRRHSNPPAVRLRVTTVDPVPWPRVFSAPLENHLPHLRLLFLLRRRRPSNPQLLVRTKKHPRRHRSSRNRRQLWHQASEDHHLHWRWSTTGFTKDANFKI